MIAGLRVRALGSGRGASPLAVQDLRVRVRRALGRPPASPRDARRLGELEAAGRAGWAEEGGRGEQRTLVAALRQYALSTSAQPKFWMQTLFRELGVGQTRADCYELLVRLGELGPHTNPCVLRHEEPLDFSPQVLYEVPKLLELHERGHDPHASLRRDLTDMPVLTIDAATATEIDDGISLHTDAMGRPWIYVHVADPSRLIEPRSLLDVYASRRGVSVYLPETHFPLFPSRLSDAFSLQPGREQVHVMTFAGRLDADTGRLLEMQVFPSIVADVKKISYHGVDKVLASTNNGGDNAIPGIDASTKQLCQSLHELAKKRREFREREGALNVSIPEPVVTFSGNGVSVSASDARDSPSRSLVEECMILAGQIAAEYAKQEDLPIPFRVQKKGGGGGGDSASNAAAPALETKNALFRDLVLVETHGHASVDITPSRHYSVGLDAYTQVTSPIRRYADLLVVHQIKAHLLGAALPFSSWDVLQFRDHYEVSLRRVTLLQNNSVRFWTLRHLVERKVKQLRVLALGSAGSAVVYREGDICPIYVSDYAFRGAVKLKREGATVAPGDMFEVAIVNIDPVRLVIELTDIL